MMLPNLSGLSLREKSDPPISGKRNRTDGSDGGSPSRRDKSDSESELMDGRAQSRHHRQSRQGGRNRTKATSTTRTTRMTHRTTAETPAFPERRRALMTKARHTEVRHTPRRVKVAAVLTPWSRCQ
eukprot:2012895-Prymnesium_polylepis.1